MASLLGTGISALLSTQRALATTSQNISNVNTEGYSRQRVEFQPRTPQAFGGGFIGAGVNVGDVSRIYDSFLTDQIRSSTSGFTQLDSYLTLSTQVDNLLGDPNINLMVGVQSFFNATQDVADDPASIPARQVLLSEGESLVNRFQYIDQRLTDIGDVMNRDIRGVVGDINSLSQSIADVNRKIADARTLSSGEPNDILDQRDLLLKQLSEKTSITVLDQSDGTVNVFIGNGQAVVAGVESRDLSILNNEFDISRLEVGYSLGTSSVNITGQVSGGELGGLLQFRNEVLDEAKDSLGYLAVGLSNSFNQQHRDGMDLKGVLGGDFFKPIDTTTPSVLSSTSNTGSPAAQIDVDIANINAYTQSDYALDRTASGYSLTRLSDNTVFSLSTFPGGSETVDNLTLSLSSGALAVGDSFLIRPLRTAASDIGLAITDPAAIAAASPVRTQANLANTGNATIDPGAINNIAQFDGDSYAVNFTSTTTYEVRDSLNNLETSGTYTSGNPISFNGITIAVSGVPASGDNFTVVPNSGGIGDNRNALNLSSLQNNNTLLSNTAKYSDVYSQLIVDVGSKTMRTEVNRDTQESLLQQTVAARDSKSAVNLDEEASDLLRFQQQYQAATQIISTADSLFQSLLGVLRR